MSDTQEEHTPGPWFWNAYRSSIGQQDPKKPHHPTNIMVAIIPRKKPYPEVTDADIRLMCAAPSLLTELENLLDAIGALNKPWELDGWGYSQEDKDRLFAVLTKAKGDA